MSILVKKRTTESYLEKISHTLPKKSWESVRGAIRNFIRFCEEKYQTSADNLCLELLKTKKSEGEDEYQLVFCDSRDGDKMRNEQQILGNVLERLGYNQKYSSNGFYKITSHSFRAYFFTFATRKHGENYAHKLTGHGGYLIDTNHWNIFVCAYSLSMVHS